MLAERDSFLAVILFDYYQFSFFTTSLQTLTQSTVSSAWT